MKKKINFEINPVIIEKKSNEKKTAKISVSPIKRDGLLPTTLVRGR